MLCKKNKIIKTSYYPLRGGIHAIGQSNLGHNHLGV